ncbi:MAG: hypothetical protein ACFFCI_02260 [Promethearchaeota archaeon]
MGIFECSICHKESKRDRYNIFYTLERQDSPYKSNWQQSTDLTLEDVCSECQTKINIGLRQIIYLVKEGKF